jgi:hypothetical protein
MKKREGTNLTYPLCSCLYKVKLVCRMRWNFTHVMMQLQLIGTRQASRRCYEIRMNKAAQFPFGYFKIRIAKYCGIRDAHFFPLRHMNLGDDLTHETSSSAG